MGVKDVAASLREQIGAYLIDPLTFPPEFVSWVRKQAGDTFITEVGTKPTIGAVEHAIVATAIGSGGAAVIPAVIGDIPIPFECEIFSWALAGDQTGSIQWDVWKDTGANFPPTIADTITGTEQPALVSQGYASSTSLAGWTTRIHAGDVLRFHVDSATTITRATLVLAVRAL